jgi:hypothetical protein
MADSRESAIAVNLGVELTPRIATILTVLGVAVAGCAIEPPLANTERSPEALATSVLQAVARNDRARLEVLALNETEFRDHVWPDLPAARPERNLPFSYVWGDLRQKSEISLSRTLKQQTGKQYTLKSVTFAGSTAYAHYDVHRDATFHVSDASGAETDLRVCGSMIEKDGWKVFSYVVD